MEELAATATHAAQAKLAAVAEGYWPDEFARCFASGSASPGTLINRGQYARVASICSVVEQFLAATAGQPAQIVSLGAGYDTLFWRLHAAGAAPRLFVEIDQDDVVQRKCSLVGSRPPLLSALPEGRACVSPTGIASAGAGYHLVAADLKDLPALEAALNGAGWRASDPTLIIAECVLVYLVPSASRQLVEFFGSRCPRAVFIAYEMANPNDAFGEMMLLNLRRRGCPLLSLPETPDGPAQVARCLSCGWGRAESIELLQYWE
jgi:O-methyltransferase involved in polyketide biosynthesis